MMIQKKRVSCGIMFLSKHICLLKLLVYKLNFKETFLELINLNNISISPILLYIRSSF